VITSVRRGNVSQEAADKGGCSESLWRKYTHP
jgi:hypothetical protein